MFQRLFQNKNSVPSIPATEAWKRLSSQDAKPVLIDVREEWEYRGGHARGAKNIPLSQLSKRVQEIPEDREILCICQSGHRSMQAAQFLQQQGRNNVINISGGTSIWRLHKLPVE
ncbi:MAG TPA: rhodanese-like domain-containing protein [Ktedonobacteraceae bacterium]|nr:rhodanese-like domain-containing protein [Ktedonobacteraceae bacterium]